MTSDAYLIETDRLFLRRLTADDAPFILELVNDPKWLLYIGDKNVHTLDDARAYIENGPTAMIARHGFGLYLTVLKETGRPIGLCGLLKRDTLPDVDIGFAFLEAFRGQRYAFEAAAATLAHGHKTFGLQRIVAITSRQNQDSAKLLIRLGMHFAGEVKLADDAESLSLYTLDFPSSA
jgi:RimJ/RimL family protein N-acetyltransferase